MGRVPDKPEGTIIGERQEIDQRTLYWKQPTGGPFRWFLVAFMILWLCGWVVGVIFAGSELLSNSSNGADSFLVVWLAGWTIGGALAIAMLI